MFRARGVCFDLQQSELVYCWRAAQYSEKRFRKLYKPLEIAKINICQNCGIILAQIAIGMKNSNGNSLHLCAQLLYGVTKIHGYQADDLLNAIAKFIKAHGVRPPKQPKEYSRQANTVSEALEFGDATFYVPQGLHNSNNRFDARNDPYLIDDVPLMPIFPMDQDAKLDFGMLTDEAAETLFTIDDTLVNLSLLTSFQVSTLRTALYDRKTDNHQRLSVNNFHRALIFEILYVLRIAVRKEYDKGVREVPSKVTSVLLADEFANVTEHGASQTEEQTSAPELPIEAPVQSLKTVAPANELTNLDDDVPLLEISGQELQDERISLPPPYHARKSVSKEELMALSRRKSCIIDKTKVLSGKTIGEQIKDLRICTEPLKVLSLIHTESVKYLLEKPGSSISFVSGGSWGRRLTSMFEKLLAPLPVRPLHTVKSTAITNYSEVVRQETEEKLPEDIQESSRVISAAAEQSNWSMSKIGQTTIIAVGQHMAEDLRKGSDYGPNFDAPQLPDITDATILQTDCITSERAKNDLINLITQYWQNQDRLSFRVMVHQQNDDRNFAVNQFISLLALHRTGEVTLRQASPFDEIWILQSP